jgi:Uma2 family endonuclease
MDEKHEGLMSQGAAGAVVDDEYRSEVVPFPPEAYPNIDHLVTEDATPLDNVFNERQQRLLVEPLYASWPGPGEGGPFLALSNVGLFAGTEQTTLVPDMLLRTGVRPSSDFSRKENRSYFIWVYRKPPNLVVEIVSDRYGGEAAHKMRSCAELGVSYYVIFDPFERLGEEVLRAFTLQHEEYVVQDPAWFPAVGLGLSLWDGSYQDVTARWLRWCDRKGGLVLTGRERAEHERQRAEAAEQAAERLRAKLRAAGLDPDT